MTLFTRIPYNKGQLNDGNGIEEFGGELPRRIFFQKKQKTYSCIGNSRYDVYFRPRCSLFLASSETNLRTKIFLLKFFSFINKDWRKVGRVGSEINPTKIYLRTSQVELSDHYRTGTTSRALYDFDDNTS